ncbi:hypothetical protein EIN_097730 [Entamoeba invadens IP1]|uniref:Uncharacterized protein n=1 Tax=Entamoeba invadens IP1 TaxID=370355 RepID=A0A0A1U6N9_ENTIV|nr:hypothetical protein EIN_097730 [Entamoeba invadens IP1]ELP87486.1 hypothetical protein EIN_097730 [Entamoeba invadens IP1]|eukprot:XP_004254257.1 hypothetical protein EIN_097730 [Entamoeba invadens IP1]
MSSDDDNINDVDNEKVNILGEELGQFNTIDYNPCLHGDCNQLYDYEDDTTQDTPTSDDDDSDDDSSDDTEDDVGIGKFDPDKLNQYHHDNVDFVFGKWSWCCPLL